MKNAILLLICLFLVDHASAQKIYKRKVRPLMDFNGQYKLSGWHFAPGLSYTLTRFKNPTEELYRTNDTVFNAKYNPGGRLGLYLEVGRYHIFEYGTLFNYLDYSLAFKQIKGKESSTGEWLSESNSTTLLTNEEQGKFGHSFITANVNLNNIIQHRDYEFFQNSIGINLDYRIINATSQSGTVTNIPTDEPARFMFQLHYKFGYGFKWTDRLFVIPMIETPILSIFSWDNFKSSYAMFSSRYRPIFFTIRFAFLGKPKMDCPTGEGNPDDKRKQQQYQQEQ